METVVSNHLRILLVEDSLPVAKLLAEELKELSENLELVHVERLESAIHWLAKTPFDAVLLDLSLPDSRGLDTLCRVRQSSPVPVVVLSANDDPYFQSEARRLGAMQYLVKGDAGGEEIMQSLRQAAGK